MNGPYPSSLQILNQSATHTVSNPVPDHFKPTDSFKSRDRPRRLVVGIEVGIRLCHPKHARD
jgi:hypothetical protein